MRESGPTTVGAALDEFLEDCELAGKAPGTVTAYRYKLRARLDLAMPLAAFDRAYCRGPDRDGDTHQGP